MEMCLTETCALAASNSPANFFTLFLRGILAAQCALADNSDFPRDRTADVLEKPEFDFIIVGGGTAGSVLAHRLTEINDWNVLLIERGKDPSIISKVPALLLHVLDTEEDYAYETEPSDSYCLSTKKKRCLWSKGKVLGGSSNINGMLHIHGTDDDYNSWAAMGNDGWSYEEVLPYFRKSENYHPDIPKKYGKKYFGVGGPMNIRSFNYSDSPMANILTKATQERGYSKVEMFNAEQYVGFGNLYGTLDAGMRLSAASAFLKPIKDRKNLFVMKSTRVDSLIMDGKKAIGVRAVLSDGRNVELKAKKEVILSAGAIVSPQILMLSGIGPKDQLKAVGVEPLIDLPVGKRLQDHVIMFNVHLTYKNESTPPPNPMKLMDDMYEYLMKKSGQLTSTGGIDYSGFINVDDPNSKYPNVQYHFVHIPRGEALHVEGIATAFNMDEQVKGEFLKMNQRYDAIIVGPVVLQPQSVGHLELRSANSEDTPKIYPNYFEKPEDVDVLVKAVQFLKSLEDTQAFRQYGIKLKAFPIAGCEHTKMASEEYWRCSTRHTASTLYHASGTCKMGPTNDPEAVVDSRLKVYGVDGLRVIDASIIPNIPRCNINSPVMMIAEKAADMIKQEWNVKDEL